MPAAKASQPTAADIAAAIATASANAPKDDGITKLVVGGIVSFIGVTMMALFFWVGTSVNDLSKSVTIMGANVENLQKSITDLQQGQGATSKTTSDLQAQVAAGAARTTAIEQDASRMKERLRILEGQKPLNQ